MKVLFIIEIFIFQVFENPKGILPRKVKGGGGLKLFRFLKIYY